jgi:ligand-binding sensor domain-containing protein
MNNYVPTAASGTAYTRAKRLVMDNPLNGTQTVSVYEELVVQLNGDTVQQDKAGFTVQINDTSKTVALLDPETGAPTGQTMTYVQVYAAMYSAYIAWASMRDAGVTPA